MKTIKTMCFLVKGEEFNQIINASKGINAYKQNEEIMHSQESLSQMTEVFDHENK